MRKIVIRSTGAPDVMELVELPDPVPAAGEIRVRAHAIGVGWADVMMRSGVYPWLPPLPVTLGTEMAGRVEAVGADVTGMAIGDPVYVSSRELGFTGGCYADCMCVPAASVHKLPPHLNLAHAAGLGYYALAYTLLFNVPRAANPKRALIIGAAGGVATALVQVARASGMQVIGTVRSDEKARFALDAGAHHVVNAREPGMNEAILELTGGEGVDLVIDPVVGPGFNAHFDVLAPWGHVVVYNSTGGPPGPDLYDRWRAHSAKVPSLHYFSMHVYEKDREGRRQIVRAALDLMARGALVPPAPTFFALADARAAHQTLQDGAVLGRLFLRP